MGSASPEDTNGLEYTMMDNTNSVVIQIQLLHAHLHHSAFSGALKHSRYEFTLGGDTYRLRPLECGNGIMFVRL